MHLDYSVSVWQVVAAIWVTFVFFFGIVRKLDKIIAIFEEYPPHRHIGDELIYPKGMRPNGD
jgi:hypothetical protein